MVIPARSVEIYGNGFKTIALILLILKFHSIFDFFFSLNIIFKIIFKSFFNFSPKCLVYFHKTKETLLHPFTNNIIIIIKKIKNILVRIIRKRKQQQQQIVNVIKSNKNYKII